MSQPSAKAAYPSADAALAAARAARQPAGSAAELAAAEAAVQMAPERSDVWIALAGAATRLQLPERAEAAQLKALETVTDPLTRDRLLVDRAWSLAGQSRYAEALAIASVDRPLLKNDPISRHILGATFMAVGLGAEALPHLEFAAAGQPGRVDILFNLAVIYHSLGRTDEAEATLETLLQAAPNHLPAYEFLGLLRPATPENNQAERLKAVRGRMRPGPDAAYIDYALFKQLDDLGRRDEAWEVLTRASAAKGTVKPWSVADDEAISEALKGLQASIPADTGATSGTPRPIFVVSLPRAGSTLVERIFAAHTKVRSLGELEAFGRALKSGTSLGPRPYIDPQIAGVGPIDWAAVGTQYRDEVRGLANGAEVVTDKMPLNWWYAPAIAAALPDATILHVRRNPMDAVFGAYKISFADAFAWSYTFEDLAAHYGVYRRLIDHYRATLGDRLIEVEYEALVNDPETVTRAMLAASGLEFEEACLKPHLSSGSVSTPSAAQVREPITAAKIGSWRRYATQLEPLRALLEADGWVDANGDGVVA